MERPEFHVKQDGLVAMSGDVDHNLRVRTLRGPGEPEVELLERHTISGRRHQPTGRCVAHPMQGWCEGPPRALRKKNVLADAGESPGHPSNPMLEGALLAGSGGAAPAHWG